MNCVKILVALALTGSAFSSFGATLDCTSNLLTNPAGTFQQPVTVGPKENGSITLDYNSNDFQTGQIKFAQSHAVLSVVYEKDVAGTAVEDFDLEVSDASGDSITATKFEMNAPLNSKFSMVATGIDKANLWTSLSVTCSVK